MIQASSGVNDTMPCRRSCTGRCPSLAASTMARVPSVKSHTKFAAGAEIDHALDGRRPRRAALRGNVLGSKPQPLWPHGHRHRGACGKSAGQPGEGWPGGSRQTSKAGHIERFDFGWQAC